MVMRRDGDVPHSAGHAFYDKLQKLMVDAGFDRFVEEGCKAYYAPRMGAPSVPRGRYFRMLLIGYFEGIHSARGIVWRCSDSLSLRAFLRLTTREKVPDHRWMSKTRSRLPHEAHDKIFGWVLERIAEESGIETPTADDLIRFDRKRTGKKLSNADWESPTDPDAKVARMKNGSTRLGYKPEHAVDLDTGVIVAAPIHPADRGDTNRLDPTLKAAAQNLSGIGLMPTQANPRDLVPASITACTYLA